MWEDGLVSGIVGTVCIVILIAAFALLLSVASPVRCESIEGARFIERTEEGACLYDVPNDLPVCQFLLTKDGTELVPCEEVHE